MLGALLYLRLTSFKNWLRSRVRRLREPKYLVGAIVGVAYFYFFFFRPLDGHPAPTVGVGAVPAPADWLPLAAAVGSLGLLVFATCMWVIPTERAALGFSDAEIAFLFPAPVSRRGLIHFRLLSAQFRSLAGAAVMMLFSHRWTFLGGSAVTHAIGWWCVFCALNLHLTGARFTLTRLADLGLGAWRRRLLVLLTLAAVLAATHARFTLPPPSSTLATEFDLSRFFTDWLVPFTQTAPLAWLLWPLQLVLGPFLAPTTSTFLLALAPAAAVIMLHYLWVVHTAVSFEDATVDHAQKRAERLAAWRTGGPRLASPATKARRAPFRLTTRGTPELAFLWKNLLSTWPYFTWRVFLSCAAVLMIGCVWLNHQPAMRPLLPGFGAMALAFGAYTLIVGPQFARQDIRSDLAHADILKTYPLAGWQIVLGQLLTPAAILSGILWLMLLTALLTFQPPATDDPWFTPQVRIAIGIGAAVLVPVLAALQLLVPNAAALVFPGWFQLTRTRGGGPEVVGQRMIFFFAQFIAMLLALIPAFVIGAAVFLLFQWLVGAVVAVMLASSAVLVVLVAEVAFGVWLLGRRFERLDLSAELRA